MQETEQRTIRVLIVDDHRLFNDGLTAMFAHEPTIDVVGQVYQSKDTAHAIGLYSPDVLLMDFNMPGINGLEMTRLLLAKAPGLKVLILSMYNEQRYVEDFRKAGACGYLLKTADISELVEAVHAVRNGGTWFDAKVGQPGTANPHADDGFIRRFKLTAREVEVIGHIRRGLTSQQIAGEMNVSFYTVETHRRNIHLKLDVKSTAELIRFMDENNG